MSNTSQLFEIPGTNIDLSDNDCIKDQQQRTTDITEDISDENFEENYPNVFPNNNSVESLNNSCNDNDEESIYIPLYFIPRKTTRTTRIPKKYFRFEKIKKIKGNEVKKGRKKPEEKITTKTKHNRNGSDNIKNKIKKRFIASMMKYLNDLYVKYAKEKSKKFLKKIQADFIQPFRKSKMNKKKLDNMPITLRQLFSSDLGRKFKKMNKDYNKNNIDKLYQDDKAKDIIELMNKTLEDVYEMYINDEIPIFNLTHDSNEIKEKENEGNDYIERYKKKALELIDKYKKRKK
jgi:hypothetical protein